MHNLSNRTLSLFSDSTKDVLLKKSLELFNKKGFSAVTTSSLASASDVLEGTLWYHFKSKKNLVESHIDLFDKNFKDEIDTNHKINIETLGQDETKAMLALVTLIENYFGENE